MAQHAVVSMSAGSGDGRDAAYLEWHLLDHLPEQYGITGMRLGQRWVSTPACRAVRAATSSRYDAVDHVVAYLFDDRFGPALDRFFELGRELRDAGRMAHLLPGVELAAYDLADRSAAPAALVDPSVVPWRPSLGAYLVVDGPGTTPIELEELTALPGVAGAWRWNGSSDHRPDRMAAVEGTHLTIAYLDGGPVDVGTTIGARLRAHWVEIGTEPSLLVAPFHCVVPYDWSRHLP